MRIFVRHIYTSHALHHSYLFPYARKGWEDEDGLRFSLILDTSGKVEGLSEVWVEESHGALLFKKMTGRDISL